MQRRGFSPALSASDMAECKNQISKCKMASQKGNKKSNIKMQNDKSKVKSNFCILI
jgi:hypothetical protein